MNIQKLLPLFFLLFFAFQSCKKGNNVIHNQKPQPIKTEKGTPTDAPVTKIIGAAGGELTSGDGKLKIIVAPGTVTSNTAFSVQPITNTLFEGEGRTAYRLLPEGTQFTRPVQLQFAYHDDDTLNTTEDVLTVASQQADGTWAVSPTGLNKNAKTLTVETNHFSDWTITGGIFLDVDKEQLGLGEKTLIQVVSIEEDHLLAAIPLLYKADEDKLESINNWRIVDGIGSLGVETGQLGKLQTEAEYGAPADMTPDRRTMLIGVDVKGYNLIKDPAAPTGVRRLNKMILLTRITVVKEFIKAVIGGTTYMFTGSEAVATSSNGALVISGRSAELDLGITILGDTVGTYNCDLHTGIQAFISQGSRSFSTAYMKCNGTGTVYASVPIELTKAGRPGQRIEGKFRGSLFDNNANACAGAVPTLVTAIDFSVTRQR